MEILVRLAIDKYYKTRVCDTYDQAVTLFFSTHIFPYFIRFDFSLFRVNRLYNESVDICLKSRLPFLKDIFKRYSGKETLPGEQKFMSMNEFIDLVTSSGVVDDNFGAREIGTMYNMAMMTQVDEINKDRHYQMRFIEFLEALCRVADRVLTKSLLIVTPHTKTPRMTVTLM